MARAWGTLFEKHRLSQEDLLAAVETVYDQHGNGYRPMAADIIGAARAIRQDRAMREPLAIEAQHDDTERGEGYLAAMLAVAEIGRRIDGDTSWPHRNAPPGPSALSVPCPYPPCRSPAGRRCCNSATKQPLKGHHPSRIDKAAQGIPDDAPPTAPPTPPPVTPGATCPICERELVTTDEAARGVCDRCQPNINGYNLGDGQPNGNTDTA